MFHRSVDWSRLKCRADLPPAETAMAREQCARGLALLNDGESTRGAQRAAAACFLGAAQLGAADGLALLGRVHGAGWGVPENGAAAFALATEALAGAAGGRGTAWAHFLMGCCADFGMGPCPKDMAVAVHHYKIASDAGLVNAQFNLGNCYMRALTCLRALRALFLLPSGFLRRSVANYIMV